MRKVIAVLILIIATLANFYSYLFQAPKVVISEIDENDQSISDYSNYTGFVDSIETFESSYYKQIGGVFFKSFNYKKTFELNGKEFDLYIRPVAACCNTLSEISNLRKESPRDLFYHLEGAAFSKDGNNLENGASLNEYSGVINLTQDGKIYYMYFKNVFDGQTVDIDEAREIAASFVEEHVAEDISGFKNKNSKYLFYRDADNPYIATGSEGYTFEFAKYINDTLTYERIYIRVYYNGNIGFVNTVGSSPLNEKDFEDLPNYNSAKLKKEIEQSLLLQAESNGSEITSIDTPEPFLGKTRLGERFIVYESTITHPTGMNGRNVVKVMLE